MAAKRFKLDPDPPVAGKPLEIIYIGPAKVIVMQVDGGKEKRLEPDDEGRIVVEKVGSGDELMLSDRGGIEGYVHRRITHLG